MSELMNAPSDSKELRWLLLTTVSVFALIAPIAARDAQAADDSDRPTFWIELGGQLEQQTVEQPFAPPFLVDTPPSFEKPTPLEIEKSPRFSYGAETRIFFEPEDSDWVFSAGIRYGRSNGRERVHQSGPDVKEVIKRDGVAYYTNTKSPFEFADTTASHNESHAVVDFQAGKDFGLGMFGSHGTSIVSLGVRFAQFSSRSSIHISSDPDLFYHSKHFGHATISLKYHHTYVGSADTARSFRGVGPSLSWNGSAPVAGNGDRGSIAFDFGLNAAILFGRQKASVHQATHGEYNPTKYRIGATIPHNITYSNPPTNHIRARTVVVPNVGGLAGLSFQYANAKVSFGYRGDVFFGAMDDGFATARRTNRFFHGPFAAISVGL